MERQLLRARRFRPRQILKLAPSSLTRRWSSIRKALREVRELADAVCSTEKMITYCKKDAETLHHRDRIGHYSSDAEGMSGQGIFFAPVFDVIQMPTDHCRCSECKYMKLNTLEKVRDCMKSSRRASNCQPTFCVAPAGRLSGCWRSQPAGIRRNWIGLGSHQRRGEASGRFEEPDGRSPGCLFSPNLEFARAGHILVAYWGYFEFSTNGVMTYTAGWSPVTRPTIVSAQPLTKWAG